jgi:hypothetical protein
MTIDEAIERLKTDIYKYADFKENPNENEFWMAFDMAIKALEQQSEDAISRYSVLHKIAEFFSNWDGDENAKMEISVNDMREIAYIYRKKARLEHQLKEIRQELCGNEVEP